MNLAELLDYVGNLLDYDPANEAYRAQLVSLLNESQTRILTDRPWDFAQREQSLQVWTDSTVAVGVVNGSGTVTGGPFPYSTSAIKPGSELEGATLEITDSAGQLSRYTVAYVSATNQLYLDRDFSGVTGSYTAKVKRREVYLPSDVVQVQNVSDPVVGVPAQASPLSKFERDASNLDRELLGTIECYLPSAGRSVAAPRTPRGVVVAAAAGQGVRTITVYMVNVLAPLSTPGPVYPLQVSDGFESALSQVQTFELSDTETLRFTPETLPLTTGLYRRYYFTCPEAGILAPVRVRSAGGQGFGALGVDTITPAGGVTLNPDLSLATLSGQAFQSTSIRYRANNSGRYQSILLYPHPSGDQAVLTRSLIAPAKMYEDQDAPLIPAAYAELIAFDALESLTSKLGNEALSQVYARKKLVKYQGFEQAYLKVVPRRIIKGSPAVQGRYGMNPYGPLRLIP